MSSELFVAPDAINARLLETCKDLYSMLIKKAYKQKRPKLNQDKIAEDDRWRYEELSHSLKRSQGLSRQQVARLVQWKITHGVHRPFLPGMIQKNSEAEVIEHTSEAANVIEGLSLKQPIDKISTTIISALDHVCKLKGVGPATGTLILSIFNPQIVPFFEDELFYWLCPEYTAKLKYDKKEYKLLLAKVLNIVQSKSVDAKMLEQAAYVVINADHLDNTQKATIEQALGDEQGKEGTKLQPEHMFGQTMAKVPVKPKRPAKTLRESQEPETVEEDPNPRRSKRRKL